MFELCLAGLMPAGGIAHSIIMLRFLASKKRELKRRQAGLCLRCGYDLRGILDRCPECGTALEASQSGRA